VVGFVCVGGLIYFALMGLSDIQTIYFSFGIKLKFEIGCKVALLSGIKGFFNRLVC